MGSIGTRLKEERTRLKKTQAEFAATANITPRGLMKWEKNEGVPNAIALQLWAGLGADVLYILTGRRVPQEQRTVQSIQADLERIRRRIIDPPNLGINNTQSSDAAVLEPSINSIRTILNCDRDLLTPELQEEAEGLLDTLQNPMGLTLYRAADFAQMRSRRKAARAALLEWIGNDPYSPSETVINLLVTLNIEYNVPERLIWEIVEELVEDVRDKLTNSS